MPPWPSLRLTRYRPDKVTPTMSTNDRLGVPATGVSIDPSLLPTWLLIDVRTSATATAVSDAPICESPSRDRTTIRLGVSAAGRPGDVGAGVPLGGLSPDPDDIARLSSMVARLTRRA